MNNKITKSSIEEKIFIIRGIHVMLDTDIAQLFGISTKRLNEQVKRNMDRFPEDFLIKLSEQELNSLRSQFATAKWTKRRSLPYAFTEHGVVMVANVVKSSIAIKTSVLSNAEARRKKFMKFGMLNDKVIKVAIEVHRAQLLIYIRLTNIETGLLLNFNTRGLKNGIKRVINTKPSASSRYLKKINFTLIDKKRAP